MHIVSPMYFMISIKLMTDRIIRGAGAMHYFVNGNGSDPRFTYPGSIAAYKVFWKYRYLDGWPFGWIATTVLTIIFYRRIIFGKYVIPPKK